MTEQQGPLDSKKPSGAELLMQNPEGFMAQVTTRADAETLMKVADEAGLKLTFKNERGQNLDVRQMNDKNLILAVKEAVRWALNKAKA